MKIELLASQELKDFPSASGIEFYDDQLFLLGDDAHDLLLMTKKWKNPETIRLFNGEGKRIPKSEKADLEALSLVMVDKKPHMLMLGSGSSDKRNQGALLQLKSRKLTKIDLAVFYQRIRENGIPQLNIEGVALVYDYMILANRGNTSAPENHLIITRPDFFQQQEKAPLQVIRIDLGTAPAGLQVSGLSYSDKHEDLLLTFCTENTPDSISDGPIGKSYLGIIENIYRKIGREKGKIKVNELIDLEAADPGFKGHKIESVCIQSEKDHSMKLHLVADNDSGNSFLFKIEATV